MLYRNVAMTCLALGSAAPALAKGLQCDRMQTHCLTDSNQLTIGDRVGIFNDDGELVATGEVRAMKGERRAVLIGERHSSIHRDYHLALLDAPPASGGDGMATAYKIYHDPSVLTVGTSLGYSEVSIGQGSPATELSVFGQWRSWRGLQLVARAVYLGMEGEVTRINDAGTTALPISVSGLGLLGGVAYVAREGKSVSFRGEAAVGGMQVSATAGGNKKLVDDGETNAHLKNGLSPYGRASLGVLLNLESWHLSLDYAPSLVYQAFANTLAAGVSKDLK